MNLIDQITLSLRWKKTRALLEKAAASIVLEASSSEAERCLAEYGDLLEHNELECAMTMLEEVAQFVPTSRKFWNQMGEVAASMDLDEQAMRFCELASQNQCPQKLNTNH